MFQHLFTNPRLRPTPLFLASGAVACTQQGQITIVAAPPSAANFASKIILPAVRDLRCNSRVNR
jgi:hypothetical protein